MTRIKDIPNFYELLHEMEKPKPKTMNQYDERYKYGLWDIEETDERLIHLRKLMGFEPNPRSARRKLKRERIDFEKLKIAKEVSNLTHKELGTLLGMHGSTFEYKVRLGTFGDDDIQKLEQTFGLDEGALIK